MTRRQQRLVREYAGAETRRERILREREERAFEDVCWALLREPDARRARGIARRRLFHEALRDALEASARQEWAA